MSTEDGLIDARVRITPRDGHVMVSTEFVTADEHGVTNRSIGEVALTPRGAIRAAALLVKFAYLALKENAR